MELSGPIVRPSTADTICPLVNDKCFNVTHRCVWVWQKITVQHAAICRLLLGAGYCYRELDIKTRNIILSDKT